MGTFKPGIVNNFGADGCGREQPRYAKGKGMKMGLVSGLSVNMTWIRAYGGG